MEALGKEHFVSWPGSGGLQGDSVFPPMFNESYSPSMQDWINHNSDDHNQFVLPLATLELEDDEDEDEDEPNDRPVVVLDCSTDGYADDIAATYQVDNPTDLATQANQRTQTFDQQLATMQTKANTSKKESICMFYGRGENENMLPNPVS